jgi:O-acetyl-ADP-ribose deacetylase (regulator of RNase III)
LESRGVKFILHCVGPQWTEVASPEEGDALLYQTIQSVLACKEGAIASIAIPTVSSKLHGFHPQNTTSVIVSAVLDYIQSTYYNDLPRSTIKAISLVDLKRTTASLFSD